MEGYLSISLAEDEDADRHYSESLVRATTLLTYQFRLGSSQRPKSREGFGFSSNQHLYLCAHQIWKFHPDFDSILIAILRQDSSGIVVITADPYGFAACQLRRRFAATMPEVFDRVVILPHQTDAEYRSLVNAADVLLDPLHFGGVNSTYDGLSLHKPIVTLPTQFHRGRYTLGCYRKMGISDCVATDQDNYVHITVFLGRDADYRAGVVEKRREASPVLFQDVEAVQEHARIFQQLMEAEQRQDQSH